MTCLVLPFSNADSERTCYMVKKFKQSSGQNFQWTQLTLFSQQKQNQNVTCVEYAPTDNVLKVAKSATLAYNREHASSVTEKVL